DLSEIVIDCAAHLLVLTNLARDLASARARATEMLASGAPRRKWNELLAAQGADVDAFEKKLQREHTAPVVVELKAVRSGFVSRCDARVIGEVIRDIGGGRATKESQIDYDVGVDHIVAVGEGVKSNDTLCRLHTRTEQQADDTRRRIEAAFEISDAPVQR